MLVPVYKSTWNHIPGDHHLDICQLESSWPVCSLLRHTSYGSWSSISCILWYWYDKLRPVSTPRSVKDTLLCCVLITFVNYRCANFCALYNVDKWIIVIVCPQLIYFASVVHLLYVSLVTVIVLPWLALGHPMYQMVLFAHTQVTCVLNISLDLVSKQTLVVSLTRVSVANRIRGHYMHKCSVRVTLCVMFVRYASGGNAAFERKVRKTVLTHKCHSSDIWQWKAKSVPEM